MSSFPFDCSLPNGIIARISVAGQPKKCRRRTRTLFNGACISARRSRLPEPTASDYPSAADAAVIGSPPLVAMTANTDPPAPEPRSKFKSFIRFLRGPGKPLILFIIVAGIVTGFSGPIRKHWGEVHERVLHTSPLRFVLAAVMFALFLFVFRVTSWRSILKSFGHRLPLPASARIWSASELARYIPGAIWQVLGRVYLVRPYGVSGSVCSTSQVLELAIFLLANLLVALMCLPFYAGKLEGKAEYWFYISTALAPTLLIVLHPKIFYSLIDTVLKRLGKPAIPHRVSGRKLLGLVLWAMLGLCWQGLAIWLLIGQPNALNLPLNQFGLVLGSYCLAWCAGFIVVLAPAGAGPRELVLIYALRFALPENIRSQFHSDAALNVMLFFMAVLLRLWTVAGELLLTTTAHLVDYRGALNRPDAPGRLPLSSEPAPNI
jgi:hypothetical protein